MGIAGAIAWGLVGLVCLGAAGYALTHGNAGCIEGNVLIWLGLAAITFGFAAFALTFLALPATVVALVIAIILLLLGAAALLGSHASCQLEFFSWMFHVG